MKNSNPALMSFSLLICFSIMTAFIGSAEANRGGKHLGKKKHHARYHHKKHYFKKWLRQVMKMAKQRDRVLRERTYKLKLVLPKEMTARLADTFGNQAGEAVVLREDLFMHSRRNVGKLKTKQMHQRGTYRIEQPFRAVNIRSKEAGALKACQEIALKAIAENEQVVVYAKDVRHHQLFVSTQGMVKRFARHTLRVLVKAGVRSHNFKRLWRSIWGLQAKGKVGLDFQKNSVHCEIR